MSNESTTPVAVVRPSGKTGALAEGEPHLIVSYTSIYKWLYNDTKTGSEMNVSIYRPTPSNEKFYILGDYAQPNFSEPTGSSLIVQAANDDPAHPLLKEPDNYHFVWNDEGSEGTYDGSIWYPLAPDGYIAIGFVCNGSWDKPSIPSYRCVRKDYVVDTQPGHLIWNDKGAGTKRNVSVYQIVGVQSAFVAQADFYPYIGPCRKLLLT